MASPTSGIFITGQPGCGKTYLLRKACQSLAKRGLKCSGFLTEEVLEKGGGRVGFDLVTIPDGFRRPFARKSPHKDWKQRTGDYVVDVHALEEVGVPTLQKASRDEVDVFVVDEIGRMELHSRKFQKEIVKLLANGRLLLASVAAPRYGHKVPFVESIKKRKGVMNLHLKASTREAVTADLQENLGKLFPHSSCASASGSEFRSTSSTAKGRKRTLTGNANSSTKKLVSSSSKEKSTPSMIKASTGAISKAMLNLAKRRGTSKTC